MTELKPCPFCRAPGAAPHFSEEQNNSSGGWGEVYCTRCSCEVKGPYVSWIEEEEKRQDSTEAAISAWNTRAAPKVKPLVWEYHPCGAIAAPPTGHSYIIDTRMKGRVYSVKGFNPQRDFESLDEAKAAAQADYERRILDALE